MSGELKSRSNSPTDHTVVIDCDQLIGPQVIDMIMNKPEFSFLIRYYSLLYQCLIPNCNLTISTLRQHMYISDNIEQYILSGENRRTNCQRLINFLLARLYSEKDYMQFCYNLHIISVMADLPYRLIAAFRNNDAWEHSLPIHPKLFSLHKSEIHNCQVSQHTTSNNYMDVNVEAVCALNSDNRAPRDRADKCSVRNHYFKGRRRFEALQTTATTDRSLTNYCKERYKMDAKKSPTSTPGLMDVSFLLCSSEWRILEKKFNSLCNNLPTNHQLTIDKLTVTPQLLNNGGEQLIKLISSSSSFDVRKLNEKIITYLIVKLCYIESSTSLVKLCDDSDNSSAHVQQNSYGAVSPNHEKQELPQCLYTNKDFNELKTHYYTVLHLMPNEYELTVGKLQKYINDEHICVILSSSNSTVANKRILDCLIERMDCREKLLDLCDQLESITTSEDLKSVVNKLRYGVQQSLQSPVNTMVSTSPQLLSVDQQHISTSPNTTTHSSFFKEMLKRIGLHPDSQVLAILKKNYTRLHYWLPQDCEKTIHKLDQLIGIPAVLQRSITNLDNVYSINEYIIMFLMARIKSDADVLQFFELLETLLESKHSKTYLKTLRKEIVEVLHSSRSLSEVTTTIKTKTNNTVSNSTSQPFTESSGAKDSVHITNDSKSNVQDKIRYEDKRLQKGFKYLQPPPLPPNHINRELLLDEIITKLLQDSIDLSTIGTSLSISGAGGFGKTTTVISLCHHPVVKKHFTDGFLFIELGLQASDPSIKLNQLYHLLTGEYLKNCDINLIEQEIKQLTSAYYCKLLVIIDDVWHVEDAEPLVKAFSHCKTILTTRMNDIDHCIPAKQSVLIGPMRRSEAFLLLTSGVISNNELSQDDVKQIDGLVQDSCHWPLLLSLVKGQVSHYLKLYHLSFHTAICNVRTKLHQKGLIAFDKNNIESSKKSRKLAVKACIEMTLELLTKSLSDKLKILILYTGIGTSLPISVLNILWNISKEEAENVIDKLWAYGVIQLVNSSWTPNHKTQQCVEVHAVIGQYITECMDSEEVLLLSPFRERIDTHRVVIKELRLLFQESCGVLDPASLSSVDYLNYKLIELEKDQLPFHIKIINISRITNPHEIIAALQIIRKLCPKNILVSLDKAFNTLIHDCKQMLNDAHQVCRKFNQSIQRSLFEKNYNKLIVTLEEFVKNSPVYSVAENAVAVLKEILPYFHGESLQVVEITCEQLQLMTFDCHPSNSLHLSFIKLYIKLHKRITNSFVAGSAAIKQTDQYMMSGKFLQEEELVEMNHAIRMQEIAPNVVRRKYTDIVIW